MDKTSKYVWGFLLLTVFGLLLIACGDTQTSIPASPPTVLATTQASADSSIVHLSPGYAVWYFDLGSLKQDAELAILGTVSKVNSGVLEPAYATTTSVITIDTVLLNPKNLAKDASSIEVKQVGGTVGKTTYRNEDDPIFTQGEQVILFLKVEADKPIYHVIGGPSGRFEVKNGMVTPAIPGGVKFDGPKTLSDFIADIKNQPLVPKAAPTATPVPPTPKAVPGQTVNLAQLYGLDKAQSILLKAGPKSTTVKDQARIKAIAQGLNVPFVVQPGPASSQVPQPDQELIYAVFVFGDGTTAGFEYNPIANTLIDNPPDSITVTAPANLMQILGLN